MTIELAPRATDREPVSSSVASKRRSARASQSSVDGPQQPSAVGPRASVLARDALASALSDAVRLRSQAAAPDAAVAGGASGGGALLQRLITSEQFTKQTSLTLASRGKTLKEIDRLLAVVKASNRPASPQVLSELVEVTRFWLDSHTGDKSRSRHREPAIRQVHDEAALQLRRARFASRHRGALVDATPSAFVRTMQGDASSALARLAGPIGLAIPKPGDAVSGEVSVKIPMDQSGSSYLGFRIGLSAARMDNKATSLSCEIALISGMQIAGIADIGGEVGLTLTAQGKTPEQALKLISYGWYRAFREAPGIPREIPNLMWGGSATSVGWVRSEQWAANIEKEAFQRKDGDVPLSSGVGSAATTNEYVRIGAMAGLSAEVDLVGVATAEAGISSQLGVHYDQRSVELGKAKRGKAVGEALKMPSRGKTDKLGTGYSSLGGNLGASVGPFSGSLAFSIAVMNREQTAKKRDKRIPEGYVSVSGSLGATVPANAALTQMVVSAIKSLAPKMAGFLGVIERKSGGKLEQNALGAAGTMLVASLGDLPDALAALDLAVPRPTDMSLTISAGYEFGAGTEGWVFDIALGQSTGIDVSAGGLVGLSLSKSSRLFRVILAKDATRWKLTAN